MGEDERLMAIVIDETNFLDWPSILINEVFGSLMLFIFLGLLIIAILSAYNRASLGTSVLLMVVWTIICLTLPNAYNSAILAFIGVVVAVLAVVILFYFVNKMSR